MQRQRLAYMQVVTTFVVRAGGELRCMLATELPLCGFGLCCDNIICMLKAFEDQQAELLRQTKEDIQTQTSLMRARLEQSSLGSLSPEKDSTKSESAGRHTNGSPGRPFESAADIRRKVWCVSCSAPHEYCNTCVPRFKFMHTPVNRTA